MNRAQRRAASSAGFTCGLCGKSRVVTTDTRYGWLCKRCLDQHTALDDAIAATGEIIFHRVSPDAAPIPCSGLDCGRDAVVIFHVYGYGVAGCAGHIDAAYEATVRVRDEGATSTTKEKS